MEEKILNQAEQDKVIDKIKKLLRLATSSVVEEAQSASRKAHELLLKYNLSLETIKTTDYVVEKMDNFKVKDKFEIRLASVVSRYFFTKVVIYGSSQWKTVNEGSYRERMKRIRIKVVAFVGLKTNTDISKYIYDYLYITLMGLKKIYVRQQRKEYSKYPKSMSRKIIHTNAISYKLGLLYGIENVLRKQNEKEQVEGLVWVGDKQLQEFVDSFTTNSRASGKRTSINSDALEQGESDGSKVQIRAGINNTAAQNSGKFLN